MIPTEENMKEKFREYNKAYFNNDLSLPNFKIIHAYWRCGSFMYTRHKGRKRLASKTICMSDYFDFTEEQYRDIMVHEMIHYLVIRDNVRDCDGHGDKFMEVANRLNSEYGLHITKNIDASLLKRKNDAPKFSWMLFNLFGRF